MRKYLTHYYMKGTAPFRSLSALPIDKAIRIMGKMYVEFQDSILFERFKNPAAYLKERRDAEEWVRGIFIAKGGTPQEAYPITVVFGESAWLAQHAPEPERHAEVRIPLLVFGEGDINFTFPDSMISHWYGAEKPDPYDLPDYHGKVFTRSEIIAIVGERGFPEDSWDIHLPDNFGAYIEAQVWNHDLLRTYKPG